MLENDEINAKSNADSSLVTEETYMEINNNDTVVRPESDKASTSQKITQMKVLCRR